MPNIPVYDQPNLGLQPSEIGVESIAAAARRGGAFFNQAGEDQARVGQALGGAVRDAGDVAIKYLDHQEITRGAAAFATLQDNLTQQWNATVKGADPNDPSVAAKFREEVVNPALDQFGSGFSTQAAQAWAEHHVESLRTHMVEKTTADMSTMAGIAARANVETTINRLSNTVMQDPSSLDFALSTADSSIAGVADSSPTLSVADNARVKSELGLKAKESIVKAAAFGAIQKTGEMPAWASDPKYAPYINGVELKQFQTYAQGIRRMQAAEDRAVRVQRDYENRNDFNTKVNALEAATMPQKPGDPPQLPADYYDKLRELSTHPGAALEPGRLKSMVQNGEAITARLDKREPLGPASHATTMELIRRMRATDDTRITDTGPIFEKYENGNLTNADFKFAIDEFNNLRTPDGARLGEERKLFMNRFERVIDGAMTDAGTHSVLGTQRSYDFEMDARRKEQELRHDGKDPHLVYDPRSEYYWGSPENVARYRVSLQEANKYNETLKSMDKENANGAPPPPARVTLPPLGERRAGQTYTTPRGPMKWTGTGWVTP